MNLKDTSVNLVGMDGRLWIAALAFDEVLRRDYASELVITSAHDGKHMDGSLHYVGRAIDVRTWACKGHENDVIAKVKAKVGPGYDIVVEADHIHCEWDPK